MIYENISKLCKERGINIMKLEQACGLGNGTIGSWRSGNPRVDKIKLVADYFKVTVDDLLKSE